MPEKTNDWMRRYFRREGDFGYLPTVTGDLPP